MIALDTNIVVRLIVRDDPAQAALAERLLREIAEAGERALVPDPVLCELVWVLEGSYRASRTEIEDAFRALLESDLFEFEHRGAVQEALDLYRRAKGDFADFLIGAKARLRGARVVYTFDRALARHEGFSLLR